MMMNKKMRKMLAVTATAAMITSMSLTGMAAPKNNKECNGNGNHLGWYQEELKPLAEELFPGNNGNHLGQLKKLIGEKDVVEEEVEEEIAEEEIVEEIPEEEIAEEEQYIPEYKEVVIEQEMLEIDLTN